MLVDGFDTEKILTLSDSVKEYPFKIGIDVTTMEGEDPIVGLTTEELSCINFS